MNILILSWRDIIHPLAGGAEQVMTEYATSWVKGGHSVTIFTSHFPGARRKDSINGIKIIRLGYELLGVQIMACCWYIFVRHKKFDLVVDQFHGIPFFTPFYVRVNKLAVIQEVAKEVWLMNHLPFPFNIIIGFIGYVIEPFIFILYKHIPFMTGSFSAKEDLVDFKIPEKNIFVIHHGVRVVVPKPIPTKEKTKTVLYLSAVTRDKGIEDALVVFSHLHNTDSRYQFWVVGKGSGGYLEYILSLSKKLRIDKYINFMGYVPEEKKFELLSRAHVLIHPSTREGWGLNVIESSFLGTPVVGYNVAGLKNSIKAGVNGYLVTYKDTLTMAQVIDTMLNDEKKLTELSKSCQKYARKFKWEKSFRESLRLIDKVTGLRKILILNWKDVFHPDAGGAEKVTLEHASAWVADGYEVTWFSSMFPGAKAEEVVSGIKMVRRGVQTLGTHIFAPFYYFKTKPYGLVIDQFHGIPFFTPLFIKSKKLAFIHEVAKEVWSLNPWPFPLNLIPSIFGTLFEPFVFKIFYKKVPFMTVSESTKKDLIDWGIDSEKITVIYNGADKFQPKLPGKEKIKTAMFLGALTRDKGIEDALLSFNYINQKEPNWQFWIVGKGEKNYTNGLKESARKLRLTKNVKFWGYVSPKKKFELLARAYILINPSVREGWGLVNIEANSVGTPVVAYDVPGIRDSVKDGITGLLSSERNFGSLATNVLKLTSDEKRYKDFQREAITWSKNFRWEKTREESLRLIKSL